MSKHVNLYPSLHFPHLVHDGGLSTQAVIREPEAAPLAAIVWLWLDELFTVTFLLLLLLLPPLLLTIAPLFGAFGAELWHLGRTARQTPSSIILHCVLWHCARRGCHGSSLQRTEVVNYLVKKWKSWNCSLMFECLRSKWLKFWNVDASHTSSTQHHRWKRQFQGGQPK